MNRLAFSIYAGRSAAITAPSPTSSIRRLFPSKCFAQPVPLSSNKHNNNEARGRNYHSILHASGVAEDLLSSHSSDQQNLQRSNDYSTTSSISVPSNTWDQAMSQAQFMEKDTVLVTDENDNLIGSSSKKDSHQFSLTQPRGILHRAFSVFLFDTSTNELLLQQRASTKITFPNVWTNTCCSHQLHGMDPMEVDAIEEVRKGNVLGAKNAAIRKLEHELGIPLGEIQLETIKYLTRVQYWAADTVTHGEDSPWGENEIDYILFITVPSKDSLTLKPHPDEVDDIRWVTQSELLDMFDDENLLFSPWFRLIAHRWMIGGSAKNNGIISDGGSSSSSSSESPGGWWDDLERTMTTNDFCDYENIHSFDPPPEHMGGKGRAGPLYDGLL